MRLFVRGFRHRLIAWRTVVEKVEILQSIDRELASLDLRCDSR